MSRSFSEVVQSSKKANYGENGENADQVTQESPVRASTPNTQGIPNSHDPTHQASPEQGLYHPQQYILGGPISISSQDILNIAEAVKLALKDEIDKLVQENVQKAVKPLQNKIVKLEAENKNLFMKLDDLEQYGRRPLIRVSGIQETNQEDTTLKILEAVRDAGIPLKQEEILNSHRVGKPNRDGRSPRQIIARLTSVDVKFRLVKNSRKFKNSET